MSVFNLWGLCSCLRVFPWRKWLLCSSEKWNWVLCICEVHKHLSSPSTTTATMLSSSRWTFRKRSYKEHIAYATSVSRFSPFYCASLASSLLLLNPCRPPYMFYCVCEYTTFVQFCGWATYFCTYNSCTDRAFCTHWNLKTCMSNCTAYWAWL